MMFDSILDEPEQLSMFPLRHPDIWQLYKSAVGCFWVPEEVDLSKDISHWKALRLEHREFIKKVLGFFAGMCIFIYLFFFQLNIYIHLGADAIVNMNVTSFMTKLRCNEAQCFYGFQIAMENIHSEMYSLLIDAYIEDPAERSRLLNSTNNFPCIEKKANWAKRWLHSDSFCDRLIAFACVEGIFFSAAFASIFWIREMGVMPGLTQSNELISRDEGLHCKMACLMYKKLNDSQKTSGERLLQIVLDAVQIEKEFIRDAIPVAMLGMNSTTMSMYIEFVADHLLNELNEPRVFNVANPFPFMVNISVDCKTNFFERRVTEYRKAGTANACNADSAFGLDDL